MTQEDFDKILFEMAEEERVMQILYIPGIYEILSEEWNNEIIEKFENQKDQS